MSFFTPLAIRRLWKIALPIGGLLLLNGCALAVTPTAPPPAVTVYRLTTPSPTTLPVNNRDIVRPTPETPSPPAMMIEYGPEVFPENVNPLTGETTSTDKLNRMPVAVKISNFPYSVRPQFGLGAADVVFEHLAEAGLTRFTAIFLQNDVAKVGSVRSARFLDTELAPMFQALLVTSGSSLGTMQHLRTNPWFAGENVWRLVSEETHYTCPPLCRETPDDTNTLFTDTNAVRLATAAHGSQKRAPLGGFMFSDHLPAGGVPVSEIIIDYSAAAHVWWRYNPGNQRYTRWQEKDASGEMIVHIDANNQTPITAANVVVLFVHHQNNFVPEDFRDGGNCGLEIQLWTSGPAKIFREGMLFEGRWHRDPSTGWRLQVEENSGKIIPFRPGNTWLGIVTLTATGTLEGSTYVVRNKVPDTRYACPVPPTETPTETPAGGIVPMETETPSP